MVIHNNIKHFTNITKGDKNLRPLLKKIHFNAENQTIAATDSHRLLRIQSKDISTTYNFNPVTLEFDTSIYPEIDRIIPKKSGAYFSLSSIEKSFVTTLRTFKDQQLLLTFENDTLTIECNDMTIKKIPISNYYPEEVLQIILNAKYLTQAFDFLLDVSIGSPNINFTVTDSLRPILFYTDDFEYVITPIRKI